MKENRIKAYCVLLAALIFAGTAVISIGNAEARYSNTVFCNTVLEVAETEISSDILAGTAEAPVTVLLGEIENSEPVGFWIKSSGGTAKEKLSWSVSSEYVSVRMTVGEEPVESGGEIVLEKDTETQIVMVITPSGETHGALSADITVTLGEKLGAKFRAEIPEVVNGEEDSSGGTENIPPEGGETDIGSGSDAPTVDAGSGENPEAQGNLKTISRFDPKGMLPIKMELPDGITSVKIGISEDGVMKALPKGTKISLDEGKNYYSVYGNKIAQFRMSEFLITDSGYSVLLDFENAEPGETAEITIAAEAFSGERKIGTYSVSAKADVLKAGSARAVSSAGRLEITENPEEERADYFILSKGDSLEVDFPKEWPEQAALRCSVQVLELSGDGKPVYNNADESFSAIYTVDENGGCTLILRSGEVLPRAGTYQAYIKWEFEGICFYKKQITFFINYSENTYYTLES